MPVHMHSSTCGCPLEAAASKRAYLGAHNLVLPEQAVDIFDLASVKELTDVRHTRLQSSSRSQPCACM